jgi:hypothetical protein
MFNQPSHPVTGRGLRTTLFSAVVAFTVVLAVGATILVGRRLTTPDVVAPTTSLDASASRFTAAASAPSAATPSQLVLVGPRRLLDPHGGGTLAPGRETRITVPALPAGATAVLLEVSILAARGPGAVTLLSNAESTPVLTAAGPGAQTSATVVAGIGADHDLRLRSQGGGSLQVDLVGVFVPATTVRAGRLVVTSPTRLLTLVPGRDGNDAAIDLTRIPALRPAGAASAVLLQVSGDVGKHGGYVALGRTASKLDQTVFWSATSGTDRIRPGFVIAPVRSGVLHVRYHAGLQLRVDLVGYLTGPAATQTGNGLVVPVTGQSARPVTVTANGRVDVGLVPTTAGLTPSQVSAALVLVTATGRTPAGVSIDPPGTERPGAPDVSAARAGRSALTVSRITDGAVSVSGQDDTVVALTPRILVVSH